MSKQNLPEEVKAEIAKAAAIEAPEGISAHHKRTLASLSEDRKLAMEEGARIALATRSDIVQHSTKPADGPTTNQGLSPCPFCNGEPFQGRTAEGQYTAKCYDCGLVMIHDRADKLSYHWNLRPISLPTEEEAEKDARIAELEHIIDRDRYTVAAGTSAIDRVLDGRFWMTEGRGPYTYNDDDYQKEFKWAIEEIRKAIRPLQIVAADKSNCTTDPVKIQEARDASDAALSNQ